MDTALTDLFAYLWESTSPYHAVESTKSRLVAAGFTELSARDSWTADHVKGRRFAVRGGALLAWDAAGARNPVTDGFRIIGAHTDSPNLRIKPHPEVSSVGYRQLGVEIYGGVLANSWLDRDLGMSGRVVMTDGKVVLVRVDRPLARVSQLAIHLDRDVNEKGLVLDKQLHLTPLVGLVGLGAADIGRIGSIGSIGSIDTIGTVVAESAGVTLDSIASYDLMLHDLTQPSLLGLNNEFIVSARIDNLFSAWAATTSLCAARDTGSVPMIALFDHEEVGSASTTGAAGPLLEQVLERIVAAYDQTIDARVRAFTASSCVSSDMAHAVHPNYAERHEPDHRPLPNAGPVLKVNANQRYATDAPTAAMFTKACRDADVPFQTFVSRNSQPCGSTIGPITATRLGIGTVDVGCAMLSMHSARELCGAADAALFVRALNSYLAG